VRFELYPHFAQKTLSDSVQFVKMKGELNKNCDKVAHIKGGMKISHQ
jgi:hypothetical protein